MMACTPSYCDDHDYQVSAPWCSFAWGNAQKRKWNHEKEMRFTGDSEFREIVNTLQELQDSLEVKNRKSSYTPPAPKPEIKKFKGVDL